MHNMNGIMSNDCTVHTSSSKFDKKNRSLILNELSSLIGKLVANVAFMRKIGPLHGYLVLAGIERT